MYRGRDSEIFGVACAYKFLPLEAKLAGAIWSLRLLPISKERRAGAVFGTDAFRNLENPSDFTRLRNSSYKK